MIRKFPKSQQESVQAYTVKEQIMKKYADGTHLQLVALNKDISLAQLQLSQSESNLSNAYRTAFKNDKTRYQS